MPTKKDKESRETDNAEDRDYLKGRARKMKLENSTKKQQTAFSEFPIELSEYI